MIRIFCDMCGAEFVNDPIISVSIKQATKEEDCKKLKDVHYDVCTNCRKRLIDSIDNYQRDSFNFNLCKPTGGIL